MTAEAETIPTSAAPPKQPPSAVRWVRENLFSSWLNTILTLLALAFLAWIIPPLIRWAFIDSITGPASPSVCLQATGACWALIHEKYRLILFGTYPYVEQWRPMLASCLFVAMIGASLYRGFWRWQLAIAWIAVLALMMMLLFGGVLGMTYVSTQFWGGLPLTLLLAVFGCVFAFPLGIVLALARRSGMPAIRSLAVTYIEIIRGVPLITVLFMSSVMFPLFLPEGWTIDKLLRAQVAIILFIAAYIAEIVRGGLQAVPKGQYEAADALGLGYWKTMGLIVLPQALKICIPPLVNTFIGTFKDTSLVVIIGLFDLMYATRAALSDAPWRPFFIEAYLFTASIYFVFCFAMSRYSQWLERELNRGHKR